MSWTTTAIWVALGLAASAIAAPPAQAGDTASDVAPPDEAVSTGSGEAPTPEPNDDPATLGGDPAARPLRDGEPAGGARCTPPEDRRPHGEVWGAIGTQDYRAGGVAVTMPIGDCATLGIAISGSKGGYPAYGPYGGPNGYDLYDDGRVAAPGPRLGPTMIGPETLAPRPQR